MLFLEKRVGVSLFEHGYRLGSMMEFSGFDDSIPESRIQQLRSSAQDFLVEPHADPVLDTWYGWHPMTWDSLPILGPVPNLETDFWPRATTCSVSPPPAAAADCWRN